MARKGTPIPISTRQDIKTLASEGKTRRAIAAELNLARATVDKYAGKSRPKSFQEDAA
jgi:DNA-binding NarL/FixJ family response regulator